MKGVIVLAGACLSTLGLAAPLESRATGPPGVTYTVNDGDESSPYNFTPLYAVNNTLQIVGLNGDIYSTTKCPAKAAPCPGGSGPAVFRALSASGEPGPMYLNTVKPNGGQQVYGDPTSGLLRFLNPGEHVPKGAFVNGFFVDPTSGQLNYYSKKFKRNTNLNSCDNGITEANFKLFLDVGTLRRDCGAVNFFVSEQNSGYGAYEYA